MANSKHTKENTASEWKTISIRICVVLRCKIQKLLIHIVFILDLFHFKKPFEHNHPCASIGSIELHTIAYETTFSSFIFIFCCRSFQIHSQNLVNFYSASRKYSWIFILVFHLYSSNVIACVKICVCLKLLVVFLSCCAAVANNLVRSIS